MSFRLRSVLAVWRKELTEVVRDRRALITTLVIPTVVMPLIMFGFSMIMMKVTAKAKSEIASVMVLNAAGAPEFVASLKANAKLSVQPEAADWRARIADKGLRAAVELPADFEARLLAGGDCPAPKVYHYEGEMRSSFAQGELRRALSDYRDKLVASRLAARDLPPALFKPYEIRSENVAPPEKVGGNLIGGIIPYVFILFCLTGALYPAIDLTAGEKERGTLETVLSSPISRLELSLGKLLTVLTAALVTVACSLVSMGISFLTVGSLFAGKAMAAGAGMAKAQAGGLPMSVDPSGLVVILLLALPLAAFFSALLLAIALNAKTTKEAQSTCSPLIVLTIMPAMMGMMPGIDLNAKLALVPILNLALVSKELLSGVWHWNYIGLTFASTIVYASVAIWFCVRQFNRETVLFR